MSRAKADHCPMCERPADKAHAPFCSPRCGDKDLLNWLGERYTLPAPATTDDLSSDERPE